MVKVKKFKIKHNQKMSDWELSNKDAERGLNQMKKDARKVYSWLKKQREKSKEKKKI